MGHVHRSSGDSSDDESESARVKEPGGHLSKLERGLPCCGGEYISNDHSPKRPPSAAPLLTYHPHKAVTVACIIISHLYLISDHHDERTRTEIRVRVEGDPVSRAVQDPAPEGHGKAWHRRVRTPQGTGGLFVRWVWDPTLQEQHEILEQLWLACLLRR